MKIVKEKWLNSEYIYKGRIFNLRVGKAVSENDNIVEREIIEHPGGVAIVPVFQDNSVLLIRQFRISIAKEIFELPGGRLEPGESPKKRAEFELEEEVGYKAKQIVPITHFFPVVGFTNLKIHLFLAFQLLKTKQNLEWDEHVQMVKLSLEDWKNKLYKGEFEDSHTIIGLHSLLVYLKKHAMI